MVKWKDLAKRVDSLRKEVNISLVGKYTKFQDSYTSIAKALQHASVSAGYKVNIKYIEAANLEKEMKTEDPVLYHEAWQNLCKSEWVRSWTFTEEPPQVIEFRTIRLTINCFKLNYVNALYVERLDPSYSPVQL